MQCPYCNYKESKVVDSRHTDSNSIRRRRECESCKKRYTTYETIETTPVMVVKKDNTREYFDREKIKNGLIKSLYRQFKDINTFVNELKTILMEKDE